VLAQAAAAGGACAFGCGFAGDRLAARSLHRRRCRAGKDRTSLGRTRTMTKKALEVVVVAALLTAARVALATPSTAFWTPATTYTQPFLLPHLTYDTYVSETGALQNDYGLTIGVSPSDKIQAEVGIDLFLPGYLQKFTQLNGKVTLAEGAYGKWQPGVSVGVMNVGFKSDVSNYDLFHLDIGKTLDFGTVVVGGYYGAGSKLLWTGSDGNVNRAGFLASYTSPDIPLNLTGLNKINFVADLATGRNWMGAVGGGVGVYFTPSIDVLTGPVFFLDNDLYKASSLGGYFAWTVQLDVDFDLRPQKPPEPAKS
jgi:hypothetical protein